MPDCSRISSDKNFRCCRTGQHTPRCCAHGPLKLTFVQLREHAKFFGIEEGNQLLIDVSGIIHTAPPQCRQMGEARNDARLDKPRLLFVMVLLRQLAESKANAMSNQLMAEAT